jgi:hypothetical protein
LADTEETPVDWVHLPRGSTEQSLWECLHDADLEAVRSDAVQRSAVLQFDVWYLRQYHGLPDDLSFRFSLSGVASLRASIYVHWPGPLSIPAGVGREEEARLVSEYRAKGREESIAWREFETTLSLNGFEVGDACLASGEDQITLRIEGTLGGDHWCNLILRAVSLSVIRTDGTMLSLDQFLDLGRAYWQGL